MSYLRVNGEIWNPACITWSAIEPRIDAVEAVQMADAFEVVNAEAMQGGAGDYVIRCADGALLPVPSALFGRLFQRSNGA